MTDNRAGTISSVRKTKWANVIFWTVMYAFVFLVATKWFIFEDGIVSFQFSMATMYQHIALLSTIIIGFIILKKCDVHIPKIICCAIAIVLILIGAIFSEVRSHIAFLICLSVVLGILADCSLITYTYEMNNSERLFGISLCHLLVAGVAIYSCFFNRETSAFWWLIFALAIIALGSCLFEKKEVEASVYMQEPFQKKLYVPIILACIGGITAVLSSMVTIQSLVADYKYIRLFYYAGAALGAILYFVIYRFSPKPATVTLITGFSFSVICIFLYMISSKVGLYISAIFGGATFNICMMNLYYILCNIIKKYDNPLLLKTFTISANFMGIIIGVGAVMMFFYASAMGYKIVLAVCLVGDVIILALSMFWDKGISITATQEEYFRFDTTVTKSQVYKITGLTDKEIEVADLLLEGLSLKEIANRLFVSENTAKTHRSAVYKKMQVSSREDLVKKMENTIDE